MALVNDPYGLDITSVGGTFIDTEDIENTPDGIPAGSTDLTANITSRVLVIGDREGLGVEVQADNGTHVGLAQVERFTAGLWKVIDRLQLNSGEAENREGQYVIYGGSVRIRYIRTSGDGQLRVIMRVQVAAPSRPNGFGCFSVIRDFQNDTVFARVQFGFVPSIIDIRNQAVGVVALGSFDGGATSFELNPNEPDEAKSYTAMWGRDSIWIKRKTGSGGGPHLIEITAFR